MKIKYQISSKPDGVCTEDRLAAFDMVMEEGVITNILDGAVGVLATSVTNITRMLKPVKSTELELYKRKHLMGIKKIAKQNYYAVKDVEVKIGQGMEGSLPDMINRHKCYTDVITILSNIDDVRSAFKRMKVSIARDKDIDPNMLTIEKSWEEAVDRLKKYNASYTGSSTTETIGELFSSTGEVAPSIDVLLQEGDILKASHNSYKSYKKSIKEIKAITNYMDSYSELIPESVIANFGSIVRLMAESLDLIATTAYRYMMLEHTMILACTELIKRQGGI